MFSAKKRKKFWLECVEQIVPIFVVAIGFSIPAVILHFFGISYDNHKVIVAGSVIIGGVISILIFIKIRRKIAESFHKIVPEELKN